MSAFSGHDYKYVNLLKPPTVYTWLVPAHTAMDYVMLYGTREAGCFVKINGTVTPHYPTGKTWLYPFLLTAGTNTILITQTDGSTDSTALTVTVEKYSRDKDRGLEYTVTVGAVDVTDYLIDRPRLDNSAEFRVTELTLAFGSNQDFDLDDEVKVWFSDGLVPVGTDADFTGKIETIDIENNAGEIKTVVKACDSLMDAVNNNVSISKILGKTNGAVLKELLAKVLITDIYCPDGSNYVGPRTLIDAPPIDIIKNLLLVEGWTLHVYKGSKVFILDDIYFQQPNWIFTEDEILENGYIISKSKSELTNKLKCVYQNNEKDPINEDLSKLNIVAPTSPAYGYGIYTDTTYQTVATNISPSAVLYFMAWHDTIDWTNIRDAYVSLRFSDSSLGISTFRKEIGLEVIDDRKLGVLLFDLAPYAMTTQSPFKYLIHIEDWQGTIYDTGWIGVTFGSGTQTLLETVNEFNITLSPRALLSDLNYTKIVNSVNDIPGDIWRRVKIEKDTTDTSTERVYYAFEFLVGIDCEDFLPATLESTLENGLATFTNCTIDKNNKEFNGISWVRAVQYATNPQPLNRLKKIFLKITGRVQRGGTIAYATKIYGKKFLDRGTWVDPAAISGTYQDDDSILAYGKKEGKPLASAYISNNTIALNLATRFVASKAVPLDTIKLTVPYLKEFNKFQTLRLTLTSIDAYTKDFIIYGVTNDTEVSTLDLLELRTADFTDPENPTKTIKRYARPPEVITGMSLNEWIDKAIESNREMFTATIAKQKYRGLYCIEMEGSENQIPNVKSQVKDLAKGDKVLVARLKEQGYLIVEKIESLPEELITSKDTTETSLYPTTATSTATATKTAVTMTLLNGGDGIAINAFLHIELNVGVDFLTNGANLPYSNFLNPFIYAKNKTTGTVYELELIGDKTDSEDYISTVGANNTYTRCKRFYVVRKRKTCLVTATSYTELSLPENACLIPGLYDPADFDPIRLAGDYSFSGTQYAGSGTVPTNPYYLLCGKSLKLSNNQLTSLNTNVVYNPSWEFDSEYELILENITAGHPLKPANVSTLNLDWYYDHKTNNQLIHELYELKTPAKVSFTTEKQLAIQRVLFRSKNTVEIFFNGPLAATGEGLTRLQDPGLVQLKLLAHSMWRDIDTE